MSYKGNRMSKMERKLAMEQKKQKRRSMLLHDYLEREIKYGNMTKKKHERCWRELVMNIGLEKIKEDLEYTWQLFELAIDIKDYTISSLMDELKQVNEQYSLCLQNHNMVLRHLLHNMNEHQKCMYDDFSKSLENMKLYHHQQHKEYHKNNEKDQNSMKAVLYRMSIDKDNSYRDKSTHDFCLLESFTAGEIEKESYLEIYSNKMSRLWQQSTKILNERISICELYTSVLQKDRMAMESSQIAIRKNVKKISFLTEVIKQLQDKLSGLIETEGDELKRLTRMHDDFSMCLLILKEKLFKDNKRDTRRKKLIICSSETVLGHFERILEKGKLLLRLISVNRKYETASEKVLSFPAHEFYWKRTFSKLETPTIGDRLFLFYQKVASIDASRLAFVEEKKFLQLKRTQIKKAFAEFCGCFNCAAKFLYDKPRERKLRTFGHLEKTELATLLRWNCQVKEDKEEDRKLREISKQLIDHDGEDIKLSSLSTTEIQDSLKNSEISSDISI